MSWVKKWEKRKRKERKSQEGRIEGRDGQEKLGRGGNSNITTEEVKEKILLVLQIYKFSPSA